MERAFFGNKQQTVFRNAAGDLFIVQSHDLRPGEQYHRLQAMPDGLRELSLESCADLEIPDEIDPSDRQVVEQIEIDASNALPTDTGIEGALDVTISLTRDDREIGEGYVTLVPDRINGGWQACGDSPDCWMEPGLCDAVDALKLSEDAARELRGRIREAAADSCEHLRVD